MGRTLLQIDAFTNRMFSGNPAAVCVLNHDEPEPWLQGVAAEMNLSETAFLVPRDGGFGLRWFTPMVEVPLCGHATLASAHALWELGLAKKESHITFQTRSGELRARRENGLIWLDMPARHVEAQPLRMEVREALRCEPVWTGVAGDDVFVELADEAAVRDLAPDLAALRVNALDGVIVTSRATTSGFDIVSRYFAPAVGIDEDPVTGSAHCALGTYWASRLGTSTFAAYQASARGGSLHVRVAGDRIFLGGTAVTVFRGELL
jgi:PhzF family phenazine biosynthesis protein